jgi:hypothetical protein
MWVNAANAAIFVSFSGAAPVASGIWDWTYSVQLQPDQSMKVGDFATIYDVPNIAGFDPVFNPTFGPTVSDRTFSVITTPPVGGGVDPGPAVSGDDPGISNVSVQLTGGNEIVGNPAAGPTIVGTLHIRSSTDQSILTDYLSISHFGNAPSTTSGQVEVAAAIPEPGSLTLLVVGLLAAGGLAFRRRQM